VVVSSRGVEPKPFRCDVARDGDVVRITLEGELDIATSPAVEGVLREPCDDGIRRRVLDLSGLTFMDSSGLRTILSAQASSRRDGWALALVPGPPAVQRIFEITGVKDRLRFVEP
jgi:anti-sigma B factor antagonist